MRSRRRFPLTVRIGVIVYDGRDEQILEESIGIVRQFKAGRLNRLSVTVGYVRRIIANVCNGMGHRALILSRGR